MSECPTTPVVCWGCLLSLNLQNHAPLHGPAAAGSLGKQMGLLGPASWTWDSCLQRSSRGKHWPSSFARSSGVRGAGGGVKDSAKEDCGLEDGV